MNDYDKARLKQKEESYNKILEASAVLFGRNGYAKTSIKDIAKLAGVSHGLIGKYFETKENLLAETYIYVTKNTYPIPENNPSLSERVELIIKQSIDIMKYKLEYFDFFQMLITTSDLPDLYKKSRESLFLESSIYNTIELWKKERNFIELDSYACFIRFLRVVYSILIFYSGLKPLDGSDIEPHKMLTYIVESIEKEIKGTK